MSDMDLEKEIELTRKDPENAASIIVRQDTRLTALESAAQAVVADSKSDKNPELIVVSREAFNALAALTKEEL